MGCKNSKARPFSEPAVVSLVPDDGSGDPSGASQAPQGSHVRDPALSAGSVVAGAAGQQKHKFKGPGPSVSGELTPCFRDGLLYRIVQPRAWFFYNDTQDYEMHVTFTFGPESKLTAVDPATLQKCASEDGSLMVSVVVFPGETSPFIEGTYDGYKSNMAARPLSPEYRQRVNAAANLKVQRELDVLQKLCRGSTDTERILESCLHQGIMFVDVQFPPLPSSLCRPNIDPRPLPETAWKRPTDYLPQKDHRHIALFRNGVEPNDIDQGKLGDCWFLCSVAALAEFPMKVEDMFRHPVSEEQAHRESLLGAYRVTLNKHGWWHILLVDDYLPVVGAAPCYAKRRDDPTELWVSLLEKAYAKLHGSYSAISGGDALHALQDLTGYPIFRFDELWAAAMEDVSKAEWLFAKLVYYDESHFLVNLNTPGYDTSSYATQGGRSSAGVGGGAASNSKSVEERFKRAGLALGHAYTALQFRHFPELGFRLVQIRNPWGNGIEWTGAWSDGDALWKTYPEVARAVHYHAADDGTFWMSWEDALTYFDGGGVCFTRFDWFDYRTRGRFENGFPNMAFEVRVTKPVEAYLLLSQRDKRGVPTTHPDAKYSALLLSVSRSLAAAATPGTGPDASPTAAAGGGSKRQIIHYNSTANPEEPSEQFTFSYARDIGLKYTFVPEASPYYVIPRIFDAAGSKEFVLGVIADTEASSGASSAFSVSFVTLPKSCRVFHNFAMFSVDATTPFETEYQRNPEEGAPETRRGACIE